MFFFAIIALRSFTSLIFRSSLPFTPQKVNYYKESLNELTCKSRCSLMMEEFWRRMTILRC